jgi:hypothetical protein
MLCKPQVPLQVWVFHRSAMSYLYPYLWKNLPQTCGLPIHMLHTTTGTTNAGCDDTSAQSGPPSDPVIMARTNKKTHKENVSVATGNGKVESQDPISSTKSVLPSFMGATWAKTFLPTLYNSLGQFWWELTTK